MSWVRIDDRAWCHPKMATLSPSAFRLWVISLCWCNQHETDGDIPSGVLSVFRCRRSDAAELVSSGLWTETADGWNVHDFLKYQPSRAEREAKREAIRNRVNKHRGNTPVTPPVTPLLPSGNAPVTPPRAPAGAGMGLGSSSGECEGSNIRCPADLALTPEMIANAKMGLGASDEAIRRITTRYVGGYLAKSETRTLGQWLSGLNTAVCRDGKAVELSIRAEAKAPVVPPDEPSVDDLIRRGKQILGKRGQA